MANGVAGYHGTVLYRIIHESGSAVSIRLFDRETNASYVVDESTGLYVKYSSNRMSPWGFSFSLSHHNEIERLRKCFPMVFVVLVCGVDGIACLSYNEFRQVIDMGHTGTESVRVSRKARQMYGVTGTDGKLQFKIGNNEFPRKILVAEAHGNVPVADEAA